MSKKAKVGLFVGIFSAAGIIFVGVTSLLLTESNIKIIFGVCLVGVGVGIFLMVVDGIMIKRGKSKW
jgi:multisubunit Na+/H+ antiporter MnhC subunit